MGGGGGEADHLLGSPEAWGVGQGGGQGGGRWGGGAPESSVGNKACTFGLP